MTLQTKIKFKEITKNKSSINHAEKFNFYDTIATQSHEKTHTHNDDYS